jgi:hypothetical protein
MWVSACRGRARLLGATRVRPSRHAAVLHARTRRRIWQAGTVTSNNTSRGSTGGENGIDLDALIDTWLTLPDVADRLDVPLNKVRQLVQDHQLIAVRRQGTDGQKVAQVPAEFVAHGQIVKGLTGTLTLLADAGYDDAEALRWLYTADDSLPGTPIQALVENRGTEVKRRAQALGF